MASNRLQHTACIVLKNKLVQKGLGDTHLAQARGGGDMWEKEEGRGAGKQAPTPLQCVLRIEAANHSIHKTHLLSCHTDLLMLVSTAHMSRGDMQHADL